MKRKKKQDERVENKKNVGKVTAFRFMEWSISRQKKEKIFLSSCDAKDNLNSNICNILI